MANETVEIIHPDYAHRELVPYSPQVSRRSRSSIHSPVIIHSVSGERNTSLQTLLKLLSHLSLTKLLIPTFLIAITFMLVVALRDLNSTHEQVETLQRDTDIRVSLLDEHLNKATRVLQFLVSELKTEDLTSQNVALLETLNQSNPKIVEVSVDKANLRAGPGENHAMVMAISGGSRLIVETEQNGWYRVIAPSGERLWISKSLLDY